METQSLKEIAWEADYRSSSVKDNGEPVDILHDFYIPALERSVKYDRVAGYFRSTSLAAASQGFTSFLKNDGHMRLIVGADMALEDVAAILEGNSQRLSDKLMQELDDEDAWTDEVKNGVALLSEMVAKGRLEVKVGFRINSNTGKPLFLDDNEDGYVHEKWFIMTDAEGNSISCSGSLNESKTALTINAENIHVTCAWDGPKFQKTVETAKKDFEAFWANKNPHMKVYTLPEAVKKKLVRLKNLRNKPTEIDGTVINIKPELSNEELLQFAVLKDAPKMANGIYVGMYSAPVEAWPHQEVVARRLVETFPYSYMMCDEVGLGKTIEAALAMRSLILSGRAKRVLVIAPAGLTEQWHRELADKALLPFARSWNQYGADAGIVSEWIYPYARDCKHDNLYAESLNVVSSGLAQRPERRPQLNAAGNFDIVLLDEAHYARRSNPAKGTSGMAQYNRLYKLLSENVRKHTKALWMATATPMQLDAVEAYDLLRLAGRSGPFMEDSSLCMGYFELLYNITKGEDLTQQQWSFMGQSFVQIEMLDHYLWDFLNATVIDGRNKNVLKDMPFKQPKRIDVKNLKKPLFSASPLARVMQRHTRSLLELYSAKGKLKSNLAKRKIRPIAAIEFTDEEADFYASLEEYCIELRKQKLRYNKEAKDALAFLLNFLQLRFASSLYAIQKTLERRLSKVRNTLLLGARTFETEDELREAIEALKDIKDDDGYDESDFSDITLDVLLKDRTKGDLEWEAKKLEKMLGKLNSITGTPSKISRLLEEIEIRKDGERVKQLVIFTRFYDSLYSIRQYLSIKEPRLRVGVYSGSKVCYYDGEKGKDVETSRDHVKRLFRAGEIDILLCTDAAAEGLNLQSADFLINFDLGWNPMKIEQRIGRIDRIGQKFPKIEVLNMCYLDSAEEIVYGRLLRRLTEANYIVGTQQVSMLPVTPDDFRKLQSEELSLDELTKEAEKKLEEEKKQVASMEISAQDIYDIYDKLSKNAKQKSLPATVENMWDAFSNSSYLVQSGMMSVDGDMITRLDGVNSVSYTKDRNKLSDTSKYLSWGSKLADEVFAYTENKLQDAKWLRRIEVSSGNISLVGYAVATTSGVQFVDSYAQLANLKIDGRAVLKETDINTCKAELEHKLRLESVISSQIKDTLARNAEIAELNAKLIRFTAAALIKHFTDDEQADSYNDVFKKIAENETVTTTVDLPSGIFAGKAQMLLFNISEYGGKVTISINGMLRNIVVDCMQREVDGMKQKRSAILAKDVVRRLQGKDRIN